MYAGYLYFNILVALVLFCSQINYVGFFIIIFDLQA